MSETKKRKKKACMLKCKIPAGFVEHFSKWRDLSGGCCVVRRERHPKSAKTSAPDLLLALLRKYLNFFDSGISRASERSDKRNTQDERIATKTSESAGCRGHRGDSLRRGGAEKKNKRKSCATEIKHVWLILTAFVSLNTSARPPPHRQLFSFLKVPNFFFILFF